MVPLLFLLASVAMVVNALWTDPVNTGITFAIILAGIPVYFVAAWSGRRSGSAEDRGRLGLRWRRFTGRWRHESTGDERR